MNLDEVLKYMDDEDSFPVIVDLCVYPNKKYILIPYYINYKIRDYKNRGSLNFKLQGDFKDQTKEDFYNNIAVCFEKCLKADDDKPDLESNFKSVITTTEFEREYKKNFLGYHLISIKYYRRIPLYARQSEENQKMIGKVFLTESYPYKKGSDWAGKGKFVIEKSNIKEFLYDDILSLINSNNDKIIYADSKIAKNEPIYH